VSAMAIELVAARAKLLRAGGRKPALRAQPGSGCAPGRSDR
jgi:hypothetical protein